MSYPPPPPPGPRPGHGPPPGWPAPAPPRGRNVGLVVGLVGLAVVLVCALGVGTFFLLSSAVEHEEKAAGDPIPNSTASEPATESASPTEESSATTSPPSAYTPTDDPGDDVVGDVKTSDFPGDWDFRYGDVAHRATLQKSVDHRSCGPVEKRAVLTQQRCEHAVQWTYTAQQGKVKITHLFLVFDTEPHAKAAEKRIDDEDFELPAGSTLPGFTLGKWNASAYGNIVGVTIGTATEGVRAKKLTSMVNYMNTDYRVALTFKL